MMGRGRMGMMMGSSGVGFGDEDEDNDAGPMRRWHHGPEDRAPPCKSSSILVLTIALKQRSMDGAVLLTDPGGA